MAPGPDQIIVVDRHGEKQQCTEDQSDAGTENDGSISAEVGQCLHLDVR